MTEIKYESYFISNYDFSLYELTQDIIQNFIYRRKQDFIPNKIFDLPNINTISDMTNNNLLVNYIEQIYESNTLKTINPDYFITNDDKTRLMTKDLRVVLNEGNIKKSIPIGIKYKIASLCLLVLTGSLEEPAFVNIVEDLIKGYGVSEITYQAKGFVYINFITKQVSKENLNYKLVFSGKSIGKAS